MTLEEIDSWDQFVNNLEKLDPPSQIVSMLKDPVVRRYLILKEVDQSTMRLKFWLVRCLDDILESMKDGTESRAFISEILETALEFTRAVKASVLHLKATTR